MKELYPRKWLGLLGAIVAGVSCLATGSTATDLADATPFADATDQPPKELVFVPVKVDGRVHNPAKHTYGLGPFAECASVLDIDGHGKLDIAAGRNYYLAPKWTKYSDYHDGAQTNGPDVDDNYESTMDVISSGWMLKQGIYWYENPGKPGVKWNSHTILAADGQEGMVVGNLAGRGDKDLLVNYYAKKPGRSLIWMERLSHAPWFQEHVLGPEGVGVRHGNGIGDIDGDGRNDVVAASGWFEAPPHPAEDPWIWRPDYQYGGNGGAGLPTLVTDGNGDGLNDIIMGSPQGYGLVWFERKMQNGKRSFIEHSIETDLATFHTMVLADLDGDGKPELITGKQLLAHNGGDVGALEPGFFFYYKFQNGHFERRIVSYRYLEPYFANGNSEPPPNYVIGTGMRLNVADMDGDGRPDIVVACRTGLCIFFNKGYSPKTRGSGPLPAPNSYPGNVAWEAPRSAPQPDSQGFISLFNGRDLTNWQPAANWAVEDGVITLKNRMDHQEHNDNYLWTRGTYGDFTSDLDFKITQGTNSGVFLRTSDPKDPVPTGIEIQIASAVPGRPLGRGSIGGIYDLVAPKINPLEPDEWNHYAIARQGPKITVVINGQPVSEANLDLWTEPHKNPDGSANKFDRPLKDFARRGCLGLQDHGTPVWYRNIRVKPLDAVR